MGGAARTLKPFGWGTDPGARPLGLSTADEAYAMVRPGCNTGAGVPNAYGWPFRDGCGTGTGASSPEWAAAGLVGLVAVGTGT